MKQENKYIVKDEQHIAGPITMEKPQINYWGGLSEKDMEHYPEDDYNAHLASLSEILRQDNGKWKVGQELIEGVDFRVTDNIGGDKLIFAYGLVTRVWGTSGGYGYGCAECCNGDRCDEDCTAKYRGSRKKDCPHSKGKSYIPFADAKEISVAIPIGQQEQEVKPKTYAEYVANDNIHKLLKRLKGGYLLEDDEAQMIRDALKSQPTQQPVSAEDLEEKMYQACSVTIAGTATIFRGIAKNLVKIAQEYASQCCRTVRQELKEEDNKQTERLSAEVALEMIIEERDELRKQLAAPPSSSLPSEDLDAILLIAKAYQKALDEGRIIPEGQQQAPSSSLRQEKVAELIAAYSITNTQDAEATKHDFPTLFSKKMEEVRRWLSDSTPSTPKEAEGEEKLWNQVRDIIDEKQQRIGRAYFENFLMVKLKQLFTITRKQQ